MMKSYFLIAVLFFLFSCKEKEDVILPAIEFELIDKFGHNAEIFAVKEMVRVEAVGEADSYFWEFGDGETSREMKPAHTYKEMGTYTIRLTTKNGDAVRTVRKVIKVGTYYADEVQLINYANSFWVDPTSTDAQSVKETTDMYLTVSKRYYSNEEDPLLFTSGIFKDVDKEKLPLSIKIPDLRMDTEQLDHRFDFYAKSENEEEGIVASNYYVTASTSYFTPEKNEGYVVVGRGNTPGDGFEIRVIYKRKLLN